MEPIRVSVWRGNVVEAVHHVHAVAVQDGAVIAESGDSVLVAFMRSSSKPLQAIPLARARADVDDRDLAIASASHLADEEQLAAVRALQDPDYYAARYAETAALREQLVAGLKPLGWEIIPGIANFVLCHLPSNGPTAAAVVKRCREHGLFLRDAAAMGSQLGTHALRIAVKDAASNHRIIELLSKCYW